VADGVFPGPATDDDAEGVAASSGAVRFRLADGKAARGTITVTRDEPVAPEALTARRVTLDLEGEWLQVLVDGDARETGYERLDNEILAGIRLRKAARPTGGYPPEVSRLYGYEATSADPFALIEPYRGKPLAEVAGQLPLESQRLFQVSLLTGLCWLATAGIAHRGLGLSTVRWDGQRVQITDFSLGTVTGVPRQEAGFPPWAAPEQLPGECHGWVTERDDMWAAGQLIFYMAARKPLTDPSQLADYGLEGLLGGVFGPADSRPTAREIMTSRDRLNMTCPVPDGSAIDSGLRAGHARFRAEQLRKHPGAPPPRSPGNRDNPIAAGRATAPATPEATASDGARSAAPDGAPPGQAAPSDHPRRKFGRRRGAR
jgi:serine/threonine protein kinase